MEQVPEPSRPRHFDRELALFDRLLFLRWSPNEDPERGFFAHWLVMRRPPEREASYLVRNGIMTREEVAARCSEVVVHWTMDVLEPGGGAGPAPLDRRLFEVLARSDPGRSGRNRMVEYMEGRERRKAEALKARMRERERTAEEGVDEALRAATRPRRLLTIQTHGLKGATT